MDTKLVLTIHLDNRPLEICKSRQVLNINAQQYEYFISTKSKPSIYNKRVKTIATYWNRMKPEERLDFHLSEIAGNHDYSYHDVEN